MSIGGKKTIQRSNTMNAYYCDVCKKQIRHTGKIDGSFFQAEIYTEDPYNKVFHARIHDLCYDCAKKVSLEIQKTLYGFVFRNIFEVYIDDFRDKTLPPLSTTPPSFPKVVSEPENRTLIKEGSKNE